jgi:hypothetical protein
MSGCVGCCVGCGGSKRATGPLPVPLLFLAPDGLADAICAPVVVADECSLFLWNWLMPCRLLMLPVLMLTCS